jgi:acetyl-CoA C-acetyltransferase
MEDAVIVEAVRTPLGRRRGVLSSVHPADLLADLMLATFERTGIDPGSIDDVIVGCMEQIGPQANTIGRVAWLAAGLPESVPATTVERQCGSSQQALHFGAMGIQAGHYEAVLVGGVESMSQVPIGASVTSIDGKWYPPRMQKRYEPESEWGGVEVTQFASSEWIILNWDLAREDLDSYSYRSHQRAGAATDRGEFEREIVPVRVPTEDGGDTVVTTDEGIRRDTTLEKMGTLKPIIEGGKTTAASSSQITDGAAAVLLMSRAAAEKAGLTPRARIKAMTAVGHDFIQGLTAPIPATEKVLAKADMDLSELDAIEINEAFASVVLGWKAALKIDDEWFDEHVNPRGGAIALGHPIGCSGARLTTTLLHQLEDSGGRFGLQTMCASHGLATATILERLG